MTSTDHVYVVTTTDSDGDAWVLAACDTLDTAQYVQHRHAKQLVLDGIEPDIETAIDRWQIRVEYHRIESRESLDSNSTK